MAGEREIDFLEGCPDRELGCFASDPEALNALLYSDSAIAANLRMAAGAADIAAQEGQSLEETEFHTQVQIETGSFRNGGKIRFGDLMTATADDEKDDADEFSDMILRVARCAYVCGSAATNCHVKNPSLL